MSRVKKLLKEARVTLTERLLCDACIMYTQPASKQDGIDMVNEQIANMAELDEEQERFSIEDLDPSIWSFASRVTQNGKLSL